MGKGNEVHPYAMVGGRTQDLKYDGSNALLFIGDGNVFREFSTVHCPSSAGNRTCIGSHNHILAYGHIAHECVLHDCIVISNQAMLGGHVEVDSYAVVGGGAAVHQFCKIGKYAMLGGLSALVQDLPPYMTAEGNRARVRSYNRIGLQRNGFSDDELRGAHRIFRTLYAGGLNRQQAIEAIIADEEIPETLRKEMVDFRRHCTRGML
jgi:UDP-N-acetylglucosamine acyltransferase